jgi:BirA family biotin operon repressor/biotin-[acetyl-CoA-carboxylase] ligase
VLPASSPLPPDLAAAANGALARAALRLDLRWYPSVSSTMDLACEAVQAGAAEGVVFCAGEQTAGRGRRGRTWSSPPDAGLYLSLVLRPAHDPGADNRVLALVTLAAGVAVREAIAASTGLVADLKWPNDVMLGSRKLAGILAEGTAIGTAEQAITLGVGVNVRPGPHPSEIAARAIAIEQELGKPVDRGRLVEELLVSLAAWYDRLRRGGADDILRSWRAAAPSACGARVAWADGVGVTDGVDDAGALLVRTTAGLERIVAGEVRWL